MIVLNLPNFSQTDFLREKTKKPCRKEQQTSVVTTQASQKKITFWEHSVEMFSQPPLYEQKVTISHLPPFQTKSKEIHIDKHKMTGLIFLYNLH